MRPGGAGGGAVSLMWLAATWYSLGRWTSSSVVLASKNTNSSSIVHHHSHRTASMTTTGVYTAILTNNTRSHATLAVDRILSGNRIRPSKTTVTAFLKRRGGAAPSMSSSTVYDFDYLVIGAGSGGIASARRAASYGARVAVIEKERLGGTCVNVGCVPKKVMWNCASIAESLHDMHHYGFRSESPDSISFHWNYIKQARDKYIHRLNSIYDVNLKNSGVTKVVGTASLGEDAHSVWVREGQKNITTTTGGVNNEDEEPRKFTAQHILIATGGKPIIPLGRGIAEYAIDSDGFFDLEELPRKAVVVGAGYIAVELAGVLQALGTDTKLVVRKEMALRNFDEMVRTTLDEEMQRQGIEVFRNTNGIDYITASNEEDELKTVYLKNGQVIDEVDTVLMAMGREPVVEQLNLPARGVQQKEGGYIVTNEYSETNVDGLYALGDVVGNIELTPMAIAAGRRLADRLFGPSQWKNAKVSYDLVPTVVFSHPPIGMIGLTEEQAIEQYGADNIKIYKSKFANLYYGPWQVEPDDKPKTAMKLICAGQDELVVGLHVIGIGADEMLQGFGIALKMGATKADFDSSVAIHPTAAEEFVTMFPWGLSAQTSGAVQSPLNGAPVPEPQK